MSSKLHNYVVREQEDLATKTVGQVIKAKSLVSAKQLATKLQVRKDSILTISRGKYTLLNSQTPILCYKENGVWHSPSHGESNAS
jgi:hypothetical protein